MSRLFILKLESFEGDDVYLRCGDEKQDFLYCVVEMDDESLEIVDSGYRSEAEARAAWPAIV